MQAITELLAPVPAIKTASVIIGHKIHNGTWNLDEGALPIKRQL
jgi:hypothetical protein